MHGVSAKCTAKAYHRITSAVFILEAMNAVNHPLNRPRRACTDASMSECIHVTTDKICVAASAGVEISLSSLPAACARSCSLTPSLGLSNGCFLGITNRALPAAYSTPSGLSLTVALTHVFRPSMESSEAVHMICDPAGIGCKQGCNL